ncbi:MAG TPA: hypothetical protein PK609_03540 [Candidatus Paceibacterota bacterium]|nr:hypothetical protein [Candidatus Paceibacterota bacterium]
MGNTDVTDVVNFRKLARELKDQGHCILPGATSTIVSIAYTIKIGVWAKLLIEEYGEDEFRQNMKIHLADACTGTDEE